MTQMFQAIRGMNDILPDATVLWQHVETALHQQLVAHGYSEIRFPIVENTGLFKRSIGEVTDIVEKEMYTYLDRNEDSLTLRPEGTAPCVRAVIQNGLIHTPGQRLWYMGPMFRHERPQKGRYRQFYQLGVETFGIETPDLDAELIGLSAEFWRVLNLSSKVVLHINSLGSAEARAAYRTVLTNYFQESHALLDEDSKRRLLTNPLRILDSKNPDLAELISRAPSLLDHLDDESNEHFAKLKQYLDAMNIKFVVDATLVRGLDYYNRTVFEWKTDTLGSQGTVIAGGRYDGLVEQLGGKTTPAAGFAVGLDRLVAMLTDSMTESMPSQVDVYLLAVGENAMQAALPFAKNLRQQCPQLRLQVHCGGGSFKSQFKRADKSGAAVALILGEEEIQKNIVGVKFLREQREQQTVTQAECPILLKQLFHWS